MLTTTTAAEDAYARAADLITIALYLDRRYQGGNVSPVALTTIEAFRTIPHLNPARAGLLAEDLLLAVGTTVRRPVQVLCYAARAAALAQAHQADDGLLAAVVTPEALLDRATELLDQIQRPHVAVAPSQRSA